MPSPPDIAPPRHPGYWLALTGIFLGTLSIAAVLCLHFPAILTSPEMRNVYPMGFIRALIQAAIIASFACGVLSAMRSPRKSLGLAAAALAIVATLLGGADVPVDTPVPRSPYLGLDWFVLNLLITALVFVPLERAWPLRSEQGPLREGWQTDGAWFFASHALVQVLSLLILLPATLAGRWLTVPSFQTHVQSLPLLIQFAAVLVIADLTQYWVHRAFHQVPTLWRFHSIHHSVEQMDWLAGSRLHLIDVIATRGLVLLPMVVLGFAQTAVYSYLVFVSVHAVFIHANFAPRVRWIEGLLVMPRFHHWHHARHEHAVDRNFAVHLPWLDRFFGTHLLPEDAWPSEYGLVHTRVPKRFWPQLLWPFRRRETPRRSV